MSNYTVSHCPQLIRQRSTNDCWAAALAMTRWPIGSTTLSSTGQVRELADAAGVRTVMGALPEGDVANMVALARATHSQLIDVRTTPLQLEALARYAAAYSIVIFGHFNYPTQGPAMLHAVLLYRVLANSGTRGTKFCRPVYRSHGGVHLGEPPRPVHGRPTFHYAPLKS
jgi:hypothetical protein